jgi:hypothetical protein
MSSSPGEESDQEIKQSKSSNKGDIPPQYLGSVLRAEIMPADEVTPDQPGLGELLQRINLRRIGTLAILLLLIGTGFFCWIGPGRAILEHELESLKNRFAAPTPTNTSESVIVVLDTQQILPTSTVTRTITPTRLAPTKVPTLLPTTTPSDEDNCVDPIEIQLEDVGKTLCVRGVIVGLEEREVGFIVNFSDERGVFYLVTYDFVWEQAKPGDCIQITGEIQQLGNTPVLVFGWANIPEFCP